jgi:hypothetical protein
MLQTIEQVVVSGIMRGSWQGALHRILWDLDSRESSTPQEAVAIGSDRDDLVPIRESGTSTCSGRA